ncbi:S8 family serine peptidase [uncultured Caulobacter sp.]|uniref:S8 family serine peptidase n=1 Tax=uncultured Caulobacter sp. TaxID=158749 RepID=UPI00260E8D2F|nr:S8 family serine peptidase [uncultured Caulobacter sp.]
MVLQSIGALPTYDHKLSVLPSELLAGPLEAVLALAEAIVLNDARTLAEHEIADRTTLETFAQNRLHAAMLRGDLAEVRNIGDQLRRLQTRADRKLTLGLLEEIATAACATSAPEVAAERLASERLAALPYPQVDEWMKWEFARYSAANPDLLRGRIRNDVDRIAVQNGGQVDQEIAGSILAARAALDCTYRVASAFASVLQAIITQNTSVGGEDIWAARDIVLDISRPASPVGVAVWDSGVDLSLFPATSDPGLAIDGEGRAVPHLLREAGDYAPSLPDLLDLLKGVMDLRAGQVTKEAHAYQQRVGSLKVEDVKAFSEAMSFIANYVHGTHVAGIAAAGNPFARIQAVSMHFPVAQDELRLDREISERRAAFYGEAVARMKAAGVRVANMSWRMGPTLFEAMLAAQGGIKDAQDRRRLAAELFTLEKAALLAAIASAPEILFVAGVGNEGNDAGFADYIPAGLRAPNLITVGAVDKSGREAAFTSVGGVVALYANGVEVSSDVPGGQKREFSGTSMASPQVANAAAKLMAVHPRLSGADVRRLLLETADLQGRVLLLNPKAALARADLAPG